MEQMKYFHCSLCGNVLKPVKFNLKTTKSKHSNTSFIVIINNIVSEFANFDYNICLHCYNLINELDALELRQTEIRQKIKTYIRYPKIKQLYSFKEKTGNGIHYEQYADGDMSSPENIEYARLTKTSADDYKNGLSNKQCVDANNISDNISDAARNNEKSPQQSQVEIKQSNLVELSTAVKLQDIKHECLTNYQNLSKKQSGRSEKHENTTKLHTCHCSKKFQTLLDLKNHMSLHRNFKPYICDICGFSYKHQTAFSRHMDAHNGISPFTCVYCNKSFTQKVALVRHGYLHTGEKPYQCDKCGKRFVHHTSFNMHQLSHTGKKSHKCVLCGLAFTSASHLKRHMRIHTGERKFTCNTCGKKFAERYNLVAHEKLHSNRKSPPTSHSYSMTIKEEIKRSEHIPTCNSIFTQLNK